MNRHRIIKVNNGQFDFIKHAKFFAILLAVFIWLIFLMGGAIQANTINPILKFSFNLPRDANTSAGIFDGEGKLLPTLWRKVPLKVGQQEGIWDYKDDYGNLLPAAHYYARILSNNITYTWEGLIGTNSTAYWGDQLWRPMQGIFDMTMVGNEILMTMGYNERRPFVMGVDYRNFAMVNQMAIPAPTLGAAYVSASDGKRLYTIKFRHPVSGFAHGAHFRCAFIRRQCA